MKAKFLQLVKEKCKDMGLTAKALEELANSIEVTDETTEEELTAKADSLIPIAKIMQGEITRKAQRREKDDEKDAKKRDAKNDDDDDKDMPSWFKVYKAEQDKVIKELKDENERMRSEKSQKERASLISSKAKELGIPENIVKRMTFAEDADIDKELTEIKQSIVNDTLPSKQEVDFKTTTEEVAKSEAEEWIKGL